MKTETQLPLAIPASLAVPVPGTKHTPVSMVYAVPVPFTGFCFTTGSAVNGQVIRAHYFDGTVAEYEKEKHDQGETLEWINGTQWDALHAKFEHDNYTSRLPMPVTRDEYWNMLECLPPDDYYASGGFTRFNMCELERGTITQQFASLGDSYLQKYVDILKPETWLTAKYFSEPTL